MLIETPYKVGDVVTIKLTSGEELVGKFEASDDTQIKINKPLTLVASEKGIGLQQFLFTACLLYTSPSPRDATLSRMPSSA